MHFRAQRKLAGELSLSDTLDGEGEGNTLSLMDVIRVDDTMLEDLDMRDACIKVRRCVERCLTDRERMIVRLRYGLGGQAPLTQREIASLCGISRSYVSRRRKCKRCPESLENTGLSGLLLHQSSTAVNVNCENFY